MDMQDKEFDKIFNSKFEDFEVQPSPMVWDKIDAGLGKKQTKVAIMPWLGMAASLLVVLGAGVLFLQKDKSMIKPVKSDKLAVNRVKAITPVKTDEPVKKENKTAGITSIMDNVASNSDHHLKNRFATNKVPRSVTRSIAKTSAEAQPTNPDNRQLIAVTDPSPTLVTTRVLNVPDNNIKLTPAMPAIAVNPAVERPIVMASVGGQESSPAKKRGIHSFGGLINVLVAKIDKRPDKIIEFTDSDDDDAESNITGVNLGLVKIKKQ